MLVLTNQLIMNNLQPNPLFHTPESTEELTQWCERLSGAERTVAMVAMGMTWNLCAKLTLDSAIEKEDENKEV